MNMSFSSSAALSEAPTRGEVTQRRRVLAAIGMLVMAAVAWQLITLAITGGYALWTSEPRMTTHVMVNVICLCLAASYALRLRGQLDFKFGRALLGSAVIFGVYALAILGGRLFFSRPLLMSTAVEAAVLALVLVWVRHRLAPARIAIIGPLTLGASLALPAVIVTDPEADLRRFDVLLVSLTGPVSSDWSKALARAMLCGCRVRHVGEYLEELRGAVSLEHFEHDHLSLHAVTSYRSLKRLMDVALVIAVLPIVVPALLLGIAAVAIGSGFPVFFVQDRVGLGGKTFRMWKLRTMRPEACAGATRAALPGDRRVTSVGRVLRRFRIDELPQLWNVLRGDMSLIGPRPEATSLHEQYQSELPNYAYRYLVRPGISGWAQVNSPPSATTEEAKRKLTFDLFYVKRVSLYLDVQIVLRTFWTITSGSGVR